MKSIRKFSQMYEKPYAISAILPGGDLPGEFCGLCGHFSGELKMNLLEKYRAMLRTSLPLPCG